MAFDFLDDLDSPIPMESNYWKNLDDKQRRKEFEIRERVGTVAPEKDGILTELKQGAHGAALDTLRGIGSTLEETTGYSGMREYFDEVKARNRHLDPYEGYKAASLDPTNIARTIGSGAAQSALSLGAGMATTALTGNVVAGGAVMTGTMFMQLYGDRVKDYRERMPEQDEGTVKGLAFVSAVGESLIESVCGPEAAFNGIAKRLVTGALKDTTKSFVKHVGKEAAKNFIMEGSEEVVQDMWDRVCLRAGTENVTLPSWDEVKETFMGGAWSGLALGGIGGAVENIASRKGNTQAGTAAALPAAEKSAAQTVERSAVPAPEKETANSTPGNPDRNEGRTFAEALYDELGIRHSRTEDGMKGVTQDGETGEANGFYDKDTNEIKINPDNEGEVFSHGHELDHWLSRNHADLAEQLHQVMDEELNEAGKAEQDGRSPQELRADMLGRIMEDPETALRIAQRGDELHVGFGEKFLKSIQEFAKKMMAFAKSHADLKGAEQYFNDYKRVRDTVAGLIVELRRRNGTSTEAENVVGVKGSDMVQSIPVADLNIDPARFQFKSKANKETGVDESNKLGGEWDPKTAGNLYVWEDKSGKKFVVNGHHRFQLAKNSRVQAVNAIVDREADGVSAEQARRNGVLINIRDEQGDVKDYADFVRHEDMSEETAEKEGILAREKGRRGYTIGKYASDNLYSIFKSDEISEAKAETIADIARKDEGLEAAGIRAAKTMPNAQLREFLKCLKNMPREKNEQGDLFGFDDSAIQMSEKLSKLAAKHIREIADKLKAVRQAVKNPETAAKGDVKVGKNAQKIYDQTLRDQLEWEHWYTNPELSAQLRKEAGIEETPEAPAVKENLTTAEEISDVGDIIGKTGARTNARIDALRNLKDGKYHAFGLTFEKVTTERSVYDEANPDRKMNEVSLSLTGNVSISWSLKRK